MVRRVKEVVSKILGVPEVQLAPEDRFLQDLGADSLSMFELRLAIEKEFSFTFTEAEVSHLYSIGGLADFLDRASRP